MKAYLLSIGFSYKSGCHCGGTLSETIVRSRQGEMLIAKIKPTRGLWSISCNGVFLDKGNSSELETKLNLHGIIKENL